MEIISEILNVLRYLPVAIPRWVWVLLGVVIAVTLLYKLFRRIWPKKPVHLPRARPKSVPKPVTDKTDTGDEKQATPIATQESPILKQSLNTFFRNLLKQLRSHVSGRDYLYQIPWVMIMGETGTGKTTLLAHTQLNLPLGAPTPSKHGCEAWLFDKGIVFDVSSKYVLHTDDLGTADNDTVIFRDQPKPLSDEMGWRTLLRLCRHYRPRRPLDGIILTIPCQDLLDSQKNPDTLIKKADYLYHKLWQAQKELGVRLPIYILITQSDKLTGFTRFCTALPEQLRHNILGWSNPYTLETVYKPTLLDEAFQKIYRDINDIQIELVTAVSEIYDNDAFLLFPHQFRSVFKNLKFYLDRLFQPSVYHETFFLRGIYFCGDAKAGSLALDQYSLDSDNLAFEALLTEKSQSKQLAFLHHLFRDKIFPETKLARPVSNILRRQQRKLWALQAVMATMLIVWILGQWWAYQRLTHEKNTLIPIFQENHQDLKGLNEAKRRGASQEALHDITHASAERLLKNMPKMDSDKFSSVFLPSSMVSPLNDKIITALMISYERFFIHFLYEKLQIKAITVIEQEVITPYTSRHYSITNMPEFMALNQLIQALQALQKNIHDYNALNDSHENLKDLSQLMYDLFDITLSVNFETHSFLSQEALSRAEYPKFQLESYTQLAQERTKMIINQWLNRILRKNVFLDDVRAVAQKRDNLEKEIHNPTQLYKQLSYLQKVDIPRLEHYFEQPEWQWIVTDKTVPPTVKETFSTMADTPLLGPEFAEKMRRLAEKRFRAFILELRGFKSHLIGGPILQGVQNIPGLELSPEMRQSQSRTTQSQSTASSDTQAPIHSTSAPLSATTLSAAANSEGKRLVAISPKISELSHDILEPFLTQNFMAKSGPYQLQTEIPFHKRLIWETPPLEKALSLADSYKKYRAEEVPKAPPRLQPILREVGEEHLYKNMLNLVAKAQQLEFQSSSEIRLEETLQAEVQNFARATPFLDKIIRELRVLKGSRHTIQAFEQLSLTQAYQLLQKLDDLLVRDNLYTPVDDTFSSWDGQTHLSQVAFAVNDQEELKYYLDLQRDRVHYLAQAYAQPLVTFFENKRIRSGQRNALVPKWQRILKELDKYSKEKTTNTVTGLEKYIQFELDKINLANCFDPINVKRIRTSGDYFLQKRARLQRLLGQQCQYLADIQIYQHYSVIQDFFNQRLAGRFPFAPLPEEGFFNEAAPESVQDFFGLYEQSAKNLIPFLAKSQTYAAKRDRVIEFLEKLHQIKVFLGDFLQQTLPLEKPLYEFAVDFRVNREHESGANQIINWKVQLLNQTLPYNDSVVKGRWKWGNSLQIVLRWARNSAFRPYWNGVTSSAVMTLSGNDTAVFEYRGHWALLELLQRQQSAATDFVGLKDLQPHTLKFLIPVKQLLAHRPSSREIQGETSSSLVYGAATKPVITEKSEQLIEYIGDDGFLIEQELTFRPRQMDIQSKKQQNSSMISKQATTIPYQEESRYLFEETSQAIVFIRFILTFPDKQERLIVPTFPYYAPTLDNPSQ
ncbi:MAG TPA: hypothetical protein EYP59_19205 [Thiotrichaceae bacterium]|nr:hypothetical protein [Thiotrichaceae bacterium]